MAHRSPCRTPATASAGPHSWACWSHAPASTSLTRLDEAGGGLNYYFFRHALKLQLDYIHTWGPGRPTGRSEQLRLQLQAVF